MEKVLITTTSKSEADKVFDKLESLGETVGRNSFGYGQCDWTCIGFYSLHKKWTVARKFSSSFEYYKVITAQEFLSNTTEPNYEVY